MSYGTKKLRARFNNTCQIYMDANHQVPRATGRIKWVAGNPERLQCRINWDMCPSYTGCGICPMGETLQEAPRLGLGRGQSC